MQERPFALVFGLLLGLWMFLPAAYAQKPKLSARSASAADQQRRLDAFNKTWQTISDYYFDRTFGGLDWNRVGIEFEPRIAAAKTDAQAHRLIQQMIARLGVSHLELTTPEQNALGAAAIKRSRARERGLAVADANAEPGEEGAIHSLGIQLRFVGSQLVVSAVDAGSTGSLAGIKTGFVLEQINRVPIGELLVEAIPDAVERKRSKGLLANLVVNWFLNGPRGSAVHLTWLDEQDRVKQAVVPRKPLAREVVFLGDNADDERLLDFRTRPISDGIGYIRFNVFAVDTVRRFCEALDSLASSKGIILDLRGNIGGMHNSLYGIVGMLVDREIVLGTMTYRHSLERVTVGPKLKNYKGRLVILTDGLTVSAGEILAAGLRDNSRAVIVGENTAGRALASMTQQLPTGAILRYPVANFHTPGRTMIEGKGIRPDFAVPLDRRSLLAGIDPQVQKAVELINGGKILRFDPVSIETDPGPGPPRPSSPPPPSGIDPQAQRVIDEFAVVLGGRQVIKQLSSYQAIGSAKLTTSGSNIFFPSFVASYHGPAKYAVSAFSVVTGSIDEVHDGTDSWISSDDGRGQGLLGSIPNGGGNLFGSITNILDPAHFASLKYGGEIIGAPRKLVTIDALTSKGEMSIYVFDRETHLLVAVLGTPGYSYQNYRDVSGTRLPFEIELSGNVKISLSHLTLGANPDPAEFQKHPRCFDKPLDVK